MCVTVAEIHCKADFTIKHRTIHLKDVPLEFRVMCTMTDYESCVIIDVTVLLLQGL